jgi:mannose-binding lectin
VSTGRIPTTLVVGVPLGIKSQTVTAMWFGVRGSTVHIDSPSTLSSTI